MVNTRILEQRMGWHDGDAGEEPAPPSRGFAHSPMLQGRLDLPPRSSVARSHRRGATAEIWADLPVVRPTIASLDTSDKLPSIARGTVVGAAMDHLRTQLMRVVADKGWRRIGITSPARGAGRSFVAAGLAVSVARLETARVLLIDTDLEEPGLSQVLGIEPRVPLEQALSGTSAPDAVLSRVGATLALALNDAPMDHAAERMAAPEAILALRALIDSVEPDLVIHDLPPVLDDEVCAALLPQLDAVILVSDGLRSRAADILESERRLEGLVPILGVVLNKSEDRDARRPARRRA